MPAGIRRPPLRILFESALKAFKFNLSQSTFLAAMAKRNSAGPFAAGVLAQGDWLNSALVGDRVSNARGTLIAGSYFFPTFDFNQGSIVFWITPEWNGNDGITHSIFDNGGHIYFKSSASLLLFNIWGQTVTANVAAWTAGTTYQVTLRWNCNNSLDGTNFASISINDVHTFGDTTKPTQGTVTGVSIFWFSSSSITQNANALIEGLTVYRRPLWDGAYGVNVGNGDEINLIYAAGAGADPCTITGHWDVCLCVPTNSTVGPIVTGVGEAWSAPHSSNLLTAGWLQSYYGNQWGVYLAGAGMIDCGSGVTLDDLGAGGAIMQVEGWVRVDVGGAIKAIVTKGQYGTSGWYAYMSAANLFTFEARCNAVITCTAGAAINDGKWHHFLGHYNDTTKVAQAALDGIWGVASAAGGGAYVSDAALTLRMGRFGAGTDYYLTGALGWVNIHNDAHYTPGTNFKPVRAAPAADVEEWLLNEGTAVTCTAQVTAPANNGTITAGTWQPQWYPENTPIIPTSVQGSANYAVNVGSGATIDNLHASDFTVEGWFRVPKTGATQYLCHKTSGADGWFMYVASTGFFTGGVFCATSRTVVSVNRYDDNRWHYFKMVYDFSIDRKIRLYVDNVADGVSAATAGAIVSDAGNNGFISRTASGLTGAHGWIMWSNTPRGAGMFSRSIPRAVDANTMARWVATEGALAVLTDDSGNANHGAMAGAYSWINTGAMDLDSPGARIFGWGYDVGSDAVNEGIKQTWTGLTAGANYVLRALAYSEDGVGIPRVVVYDETNAAAITAITGLATSTEWTPDVFIISFELPTAARGAAADCTSISIKLISTTAGNVGWHQIELLA